jgi:hypothetical protein
VSDATHYWTRLNELKQWVNRGLLYRREHRQPARKRLWFIPAIGVGLAMTFLMVDMAVLASARLLPRGENAAALDLLDTLMPGQPGAVLSQYSHQCLERIMNETNTETVYCEIRRSGPFRVITVTLEYDIINRLSVSVDGLQAIDLIDHWGQPDGIVFNGGNTILNWRNHIFATVNRSARLSYADAVHSIIVLPSPTKY